MQIIKMPSAGQTTDEATIASIKVKVGDTVKRGDVLLEAETDKAVLPVESFAAGEVLAVLVGEGDTVTAGQGLVAVGAKGEAYQEEGTAAPVASAASVAAAAPAAAAVPAASPVNGRKIGTEIKMPSAGQTTDEATIAAVKVKAGDAVKRGDILLEAETDKAVLPVESFAAGVVLEVKVSEGDKVAAGDVLVVVGKAEDAEQYRAAQEKPAAAEVSAVTALPEEQEEYLPIIKGQKRPAPVRPADPAPRGGFPAMPNAKMLAREKGICIHDVPASNGVFVKRVDVENYRAPKAVEEPKAAAPAVTAVSEYEVMPMTRMRQIIGRRMQESLQNIPCWQCTMMIKMDKCMELRQVFQQEAGLKLSYNDMMAKAIAVAARKFPLVKARCENGEVRIYQHTNVGLAVALDGALVVPVVKEIDTKGLEEISKAYKEQVSKARENRLAPADMGCGSITISNLGMYDVDQFIAIDNPPESCILAVGAIKVKPEWDGEKFVPAHMMSVTGSFDHRIIDGAYGAQFLQELKRLMENPTLMLK